MNDQPLVSVVVVTYNSARTVIETLDSISSQTYKHIELIVSDDGSKDETIDIVSKWIESRKDCFVRAELITVEKNTGTVKNLNRGIKASKGDWIKSIAGDDCLLPNCIENNVSYIKNNAECEILFSKVEEFGEGVTEKYKTPFLYKAFDFDKRDFNDLLMYVNFLPAPSAFYKKDTLISLGGYDESVPLVEDWPMWLKYIDASIEIHFMDIVTVRYRVYNKSISMSRDRKGAFYNSMCLCYKISLNYLYERNKLLWIAAAFRFYYYRDTPLLRYLYKLNSLNPQYCRIKKLIRESSNEQ